MKTARKPSAKKIDLIVSSLCEVKIQNIQFNVFDLGKLTDAGVAAYTESGGDMAAVSAALDAAIAKYRKN